MTIFANVPGKPFPFGDKEKDSERTTQPRFFSLVVCIGMLAICAHGLWKPVLWKSAEPRVMEIARGQFTHGMMRLLDFAGMPFLEKPSLYFDLTAIAFHLAGGPSIFGARAVVTLMSLLWFVAIMLTVYHAAGKNAAILVGALLVVAPGFFRMARRMSVDIALVALLSLSMLFFYLALSREAKRLICGWWWACLATAGLAALTKGMFATFLFLAPTLAYALLARDRRVVMAIVHPLSLLCLLAPHLLWGVILYHGGGMTYIYEYFINNTIGRVLHFRFELAGVVDLPYGDVGVKYPWYYFVLKIPELAIPGVIAVPFALFALKKNWAHRACDNCSRLSLLSLCWGVVPALILSFSSYKGRYHLGASVSALIILGAVWLARQLDILSASHKQRRAFAGAMILYAAAPIAVIAAFCGLPATKTGAIAMEAAAGVIAFCGLFGALYARRLDAALYVILAALTVIFTIDFSPGSNLRDDERYSMDAFSMWVKNETENSPVAVCTIDDSSDWENDRPGLAGELEVGSLSYWLGRPVVRLRSSQVREFLSKKSPAFLVDCGGKGKLLPWAQKNSAIGWVAIGGNRRKAYSLIANHAALTHFPAPHSPPPNTTDNTR